jgi:uncharacterized protein (TIGR03643 family)
VRNTCPIRAIPNKARNPIFSMPPTTTPTAITVPPVFSWIPCDANISRVVEMAWEDRTAFEAIEAQFGLNESAVIALMRRHMKRSSFRMWRERMAGRRTKHAKLRGAVLLRHRASHTRQS